MKTSTERITIVQEGYKGLAERVKEESRGGKILLYTERGREGEDALAALSLAGLKVTRKEVSEETLSDWALLLETETAEGITAVVGAGGAPALQAAKAARVGRKAPVLLFPTDLSGLSAADERTYFGTKGDILRLRSEDHRVLLDPEKAAAGAVGRGLGYLLALLVECFDGAYEATITKGKSPAASLRVIGKCAAALREIREEDAAPCLVKAMREYDKQGLLCKAPPLGTVHHFAILSSKWMGGCYLDYLFPAAYALVKLYARYLGDLPLEHCPPPDRVRTAELLSERCKMDEAALLKKAELYADGFAERGHRTAEYREDFAECLTESVLPLTALCRVWRRSDGKREKSPSVSELLALFSLTGEAVSGYPLLKHIMTTGLIEPLLLAS